MPNKGSLSILIIEDNPGDFILVEEFLFEQIEAPSISHVTSYKKAKELLLISCAFDIILMDISLPDIGGLPLIVEIVEICLNTPIIVLTGYEDFSFGVKSLSLGIADYILKDELTALTLYKSIIYSIERKKILSSLEISEKRVRSFAKQLNDALEEDRARIAREIHDEFGQQLSGLKMSLSALKKFKGTPGDLAAVIDTIVADVNTSIQSARQIANELQPVLIDKLGLFAAIEWLVNEFEKKQGITSRIYVEIHQPPINKTLAINIFRIVQEALTNIAKHAEATMVTIRIENMDGLLCLNIMDNGKGIKASTLHNPLSMGLLNMRERANLITAELKVTSAADQGTSIELKVMING